jgi:hypothetical protein
MNKPDLTPEQKSAMETVQAKGRTGEKLAEHDRIRKDVRIELPPKPISNPTVSKK